MKEGEDIFLVKKLGEDDIAAIEVLYIRYAPQVKSFVLAVMKNESDSEDIVQDIFLKIWEERDKLANIRSFKSYLYSMTRNMVYNRLKKKSVHQRYISSAGKEQMSADPERRIVTKDLLHHIHTEIENLPKHQRNIYEMNREDSLTYNEISERLGISPKTIQYHIGKVLARLKKIEKK